MSRLARVPQPADGDERHILLGWLAFHRNALEAKCHGLTAEQLAAATHHHRPCPCSGWRGT